MKKYPNKNLSGYVKLLSKQVLMPALGVDSRLFESNRKPYRKYLLNVKEVYGGRNYRLHKFCSRKDVHLGLINYHHISERTEDWLLNGYQDGIEYRYPLLDKDLIEFILTVPSKILFKDGYVRILLREASKGILPDNVIWYNNKLEPVRYEYVKKLSGQIFFESLSEIHEYKENHYMDFVNFSALETDISKVSEDLDSDDFWDTINFILYLRQINEFTKAYHKLS